MHMRLDKFVSEQTGVSRSEAKKLIRDGRITLNGAAAPPPETKTDPENDCVALEGSRILYKKYIYIMLNKPAGVVCAVKDRLSGTVIELIPPELRRRGLFPAGRLDKDTEGFVLITDDGGLAHRMLSPAHHVEKEYEVTLERPAEDGYIKLFAEGMTIDGGEKCLPAVLEFIPERTDRRRVRLILTEGKYHQVKRMMEAAGNRVVSLKRTRIGGVKLDPKLAPGECREILHKESLNLYAK